MNKAFDSQSSGDFPDRGPGVTLHKNRHLAQNMGDAALLIDEKTGRILDANPQAEFLLGRTRAEIIAMNQREMYPDKSPPPPSGRVPGLRMSASGEAQIRRKNGVTIPVSICASPKMA